MPTSCGLRRTGPLTVTTCVLIASAPLASVTRSRIGRVPFLRLEVDTTAPVRSHLPSLLKSHSCLASAPSGSLEVDANVTDLPWTGLEGDTVNDACGGALTTIVSTAMA